jgi:hypothetical protein
MIATAQPVTAVELEVARVLALVLAPVPETVPHAARSSATRRATTMRAGVTARLLPNGGGSRAIALTLCRRALH